MIWNGTYGGTNGAEGCWPWGKWKGLYSKVFFVCHNIGLWHHWWLVSRIKHYLWATWSLKIRLSNKIYSKMKSDCFGQHDRTSCTIFFTISQSQKSIVLDDNLEVFIQMMQLSTQTYFVTSVKTSDTFKFTWKRIKIN